MQLSFAGQVAVVVGAASGIGKAAAERFRASGAIVVWIDLADDVQEVANHGEGARSLAFQGDATDHARMQAIAESIQQTQGRIDHVVVSIGMASGTFGFPFWNLEPSVWDRVLQVNLTGAVNVAHAFVPHMLPRRTGTFCFVSSIAGQTGSQTDPPYSAAKAGLINFTQCAAKDLAPHNIRVNAVSPGMVKTPLNRKVWEAWRSSSPDNSASYDEWADAKIKQVAPLGRWQSPEDIANMIAFLASEFATNVTGQTLNVDGGQVMHS